MTLISREFPHVVGLTRVVSPLSFQKEFGSASPYIYEAIAKDQTLKSAQFKWYRINGVGM